MELIDQSEQLEQALDRALGEAEHRVAELQGQLDQALTAMDRSASPAVSTEELGELFDSLSRLCHQINNPLTAIMGRAQMLQMKCQRGGDEQLARSANVIEESGKRVARLVQELATLVCQSRKQMVETYDSSNGSR